MSQIKLDQCELLLSEPIEMAYQLQQKPLIQSKQGQTKNRKWTDQEHVLYILFLELNRNKIKSKLIRRSNSFYKEMAVFVKGKNGIQCRSHHQIYENRYKYPHKIIKEEKEKLDQQLYNSIKASLEFTSSPSSSMTAADTEAKPQPIKIQKECEHLKTVSCQTQIQGVDQILLKPQQLNAYYNWINQMTAYYHSRRAEWMLQWYGPRDPYDSFFSN